MNTDAQPSQPKQLRRELGFLGAITTGLGSILGTGVFVSIGIAAGVAGPNVLLSVFLAAIVAIFNGLSSAQLAANHPVSGGTYEYGHRWLSPSLGFIAGWLFLCAKSASAATAALGLAGYIAVNMGLSGYFPTVAIAFSILLLLTMVTLVGIKRTSVVNMLIVGISVAALLTFVILGFPTGWSQREANLFGLFDLSSANGESLLQATALMFVAYTGYGRIATMGEEVRDPAKTIPRAIIATLAISMLIYLAVAFVAVSNVGASELGNAEHRAAPLTYVAQRLNSRFLMTVISIGAATAMVGVLLNLLLGLSRVALAMARRHDLPARLSLVDQRGVPAPSTIFVAVVIAAISLLGDVKIAWSLSAFAVLMYYGLTNLCAIQIEPAKRMFPVWTAWCGLIACVSLLFWIEREIAVVGLVMVAIGFALRWVIRRLGKNQESE